MDYSLPSRAERLAAEYVLGTLRGAARRRLERVLPIHPALQLALSRWQWRLQALASPVQAVEPPPRVWERLQQRVFDAPVLEAALA